MTMAYNLILIMNGASFFGRTIPNGLADKYGRFNVLIIMLFFTGVITLALWLPGRSNAANIVFAALFGIGSGTTIGIAALTSLPIAGAIAEIDGGSFRFAALFSGVNFMVATIFLGGNHQRVFLAADACHQTIPSGGYGMNMGLADTWDLGWKLAATVKGWGGTHLMKTYEQERRPVAALMQHWSKIHMMKLMGLSTTVKLDPVVIESIDERGIALREEIDQYIQQNDDHNQSFGVEMGHRYESSLAVLNEQVDVEKAAPQFDSRNYLPTTFPGSRVPHVALSDGSAISDGFGKGFTMVAFLQKEAVAAGDQFQVPIALASFEEAARQHSIPLKSLCLMNETHAFRIWDACLVLVRPDGFSAWRSDSLDKVHNASQVLLQATGHTSPL
ncbi:monooxygenase [Penicillium taxi]|uniref:monooxygenase n=1 Tax=Penicillium taxi TaxID=168475 RepID=UPI002545B28D|nr:monooxygenase [Penicillium taxi]KAJ5885451.1 monooxygenase [Penicillium taxi]